ncbi:S9 family peptidase [Flavihumibacter rivuli]|uniref:S9 family peptidase n=1 Tax=Flavihumibacter rivuli TaxID=2838156 RepID=UPI001BDDFB49|nr:S9 family peptidase [Flavihumibacter rivuli]ULQ58146.1 S9 family peptidase [Flavihumibacter rivuli]
MKKFNLLICFMATFMAGYAQSKRPLSPADIYRLQTPSSPQVSPDGEWVIYELRSADSLKDKFTKDLWMVSWDGKQQVQLTYDPGNEGNALFSPDGRYISFIASRGDEKYGQVYLLDRRGGEARKITNVKGGIEDYAWSPDGTKMVMAIADPDYADTASTKVRKPYVIDRYHFKQDIQGYLDSSATHLYLYDLEAKKLDTLTRGIHNESQPVFSPDGKWIAFVSNRTANPDRNDNADIFIMEARAGATMKQLTTWEGEDARPVWSPDGKKIAYLQSSSNEPFTMYGHHYAAVVPVEGGTPQLVTKAIDRPVRNLRWAKDGNSLFTLMEDDRQCLVASFDIASGKLTRVADGEKSFAELEPNMAKNAWITTLSSPTLPTELFAVEGNSIRRLTHIQDSFLAPLILPVAEGFSAKAKDGNMVNGILFKPANLSNGQKLPLMIFIHGGPVAQDEYEFDMTRMIYASAGYAVAAVNYRGSSGRGIDYIRSIYGDWGNKEVVDVIATADHLVAKGIADPQKMGLAGWSYGGITTNYTIATDTRFKAAVSGAGSSLQLSLYGSDQYVTQYEKELGYPWKNPEKWMKVSYPFFKADKIKTPTLFMASESDFNVPVAGAEQMYQALKAVGVPTGLIIYPNQFHGITVPSYLKDRFERHVNWFNTHLKPNSTARPF